MKRAFVEVVEIATGKVIHTVDVTKKTPSQRDRVEEGMLINMNRECYFTRQKASRRKP
jgi:hypothetical protein